ncbi:MAG: DUF4199 domain-containing protein [Ferruginibacter sp.]
MKNISPKYIGLVTAAAMVVASLLLFYLFHFPENGKNQYFIYAVYAIGIIASLVLYKQIDVGEKTFKDYFSEGFKVFVVVTLIMAAFTFVFYKMNPQILDNALVEINSFNAKDENKTPAEVTANAEKLRGIFIPMMIATTTVKNLVLGALITIVAAGFLSQKKSV